MRSRNNVLVALLLLAVIGGLLLVGDRRDRAARAQIGALETRVWALEQERIRAVAQVDTARTVYRERRQSVGLGDSVVRVGIRTARRVLDDSTATADTLRATLVRTIEKVERYQAEVAAFQLAVDTLVARQETEREAWAAQIEGLEALVQTERSTRCQILGRPCPGPAALVLSGVLLTFLIALL